MEKGRRGRDAAGNQTPDPATYNWEGYHRHRSLPEEPGAQAPPWAPPGPRDLHWEDEPSYCLALKFRRFNFSESRKATGYQDSALKGQAQYLIQADTQHRESSLKSARVLHGDLLTNFRACVGKSGICKSLLQPCKYWKTPLFLSFFSLVGQICGN